MGMLNPLKSRHRMLTLDPQGTVDGNYSQTNHKLGSVQASTLTLKKEGMDVKTQQ